MILRADSFWLSHYWLERLACWWRGHNWWSPDSRHTKVMSKEDSAELVGYRHCEFCGREEYGPPENAVFLGYWNTSAGRAYSPHSLTVEFVSLIPPKPSPTLTDHVSDLLPKFSEKKERVKKYRSIDDN